MLTSRSRRGQSPRSLSRRNGPGASRKSRSRSRNSERPPKPALPRRLAVGWLPCLMTSAFGPRGGSLPSGIWLVSDELRKAKCAGDAFWPTDGRLSLSGNLGGDRSREDWYRDISKRGLAHRRILGIRFSVDAKISGQRLRSQVTFCARRREEGRVRRRGWKAWYATNTFHVAESSFQRAGAKLWLGGVLEMIVAAAIENRTNSRRGEDQSPFQFSLVAAAQSSGG